LRRQGDGNDKRPVFWFGLGLIIFARIMRVSAGMRADLEGMV
jgi:hypothetical protein